MAHVDRIYKSVACPDCGVGAGEHCVKTPYKTCSERMHLAMEQRAIEIKPWNFKGVATFNFKAKGYLASSWCKKGRHEGCTGKSHPQKGVLATCSCKCHGSRRATARTSIDTRYVNFEQYPPRRSGKPKSQDGKETAANPVTAKDRGACP